MKTATEHQAPLDREYPLFGFSFWSVALQVSHLVNPQIK